MMARITKVNANQVVIKDQLERSWILTDLTLIQGRPVVGKVLYMSNLDLTRLTRAQ